MKILVRCILLICIASTFLACDKKEEVQTVSYDNEYSVELPVYLKKVNNLNKDASLQYMNSVKGLCVMMIDESKEDFFNLIKEKNNQDNYSSDLEGYSKMLIERIGENFHFIEDPIVEDVSINGMDAKYLSFAVRIATNDFYYEIAVINGEKKYYQLYTWVPVNFKSKEQNSMKGILESFEEL